MTSRHTLAALAMVALGALATLGARPAQAQVYAPLPYYTGLYPAYAGAYYPGGVVAYRRPLLRPFAPPRIVGYAPALAVAPTVVGYAPAYASPAVVNYAPSYSVPMVTNYAPSYAVPTVTNYAPSYAAPTVVNYPGRTVYYGAPLAPLPAPAVTYPLPSVVYPPAVFP